MVRAVQDLIEVLDQQAAFATRRPFDPINGYGQCCDRDKALVMSCPRPDAALVSKALGDPFSEGVRVHRDERR